MIKLKFDDREEMVKIQKEYLGLKLLSAGQNSLNMKSENTDLALK